MNTYLEYAKNLKIGGKFTLDSYSMGIRELAKIVYDIMSLDYTWRARRISDSVIEYERLQ